MEGRERGESQLSRGTREGGEEKVGREGREESELTEKQSHRNDGVHPVLLDETVERKTKGGAKSAGGRRAEGRWTREGGTNDFSTSGTATRPVVGSKGGGAERMGLGRGRSEAKDEGSQQSFERERDSFRRR